MPEEREELGLCVAFADIPVIGSSVTEHLGPVISLVVGLGDEVFVIVHDALMADKDGELVVVVDIP